MNNLLFKFLEDSSSITSESEPTGLEPGNWNWELIWKNFVIWCKTDGIKFLCALLVVIILFIIINCVAKGIKKKLLKSKKNKSVANVVYSTIRKVLKFLVIIMFLGYIGIDMAGISSIIASCAVAIGLAIQGSLSNIAGWIIIIINRPFKLDDYISAQGQSGTVEEINLFYTHLKTVDNKVVLLPNGALSNGTIINFSAKPIRRVDEDFSIEYSADPQQAINAIKKVISKNKSIMKTPEPFVKVTNYADSAIIVTSKCWVKSEDYWDVHFYLLEKVKQEFDTLGIGIPYNKLDVNVISVETPKAKAKKANTIKKTEK